MLKKKHSEIYEKSVLGGHSPFRNQANRSPFSRTPDRSNLSPIKRHLITQHNGNKTPRKLLTGDIRSNKRSPIKPQINFETQLESLASSYLPQYDNSSRFNSNKSRVKVGGNPQSSAFMNMSNLSSQQPSEKNMKESKKLFTRYISEMNSEKKKNGGEFSNQNSVFEDSKQNGIDNNYPNENCQGASFRALKQIKMIESVQPQKQPEKQKFVSEKKPVMMPFAMLQKRRSEQQTNRHVQPPLVGEVLQVNEFKTEQKKKKQVVVQLINQSFSSIPTGQQPSNPSPTIEGNKPQRWLQQKAKPFQSVYLDESSSYADFNLLMKLVKDGCCQAQRIEQQQLVRMSIQSAKDGLSMDPFL